MTKRAGILARISKKDKKVPKVENQVLICQGIADDEGYAVDPRHIFIDDGIAASGKDVDDTTLENRPGSRACLEAMRRGEIDVLISVERERLARTYLDGLEFIKASVQGNVIWHLDTDGILDPRTPAGEETAVSIFASGRREGRVRLARQRRRYDRELSQGLPLWNTRPFGYEDRIHIRESEAVHIRQAVKDYLAGEVSMTGIAKRWNDMGIKTDGMSRPRRRRGDEPGSEQKDPLYDYWVTSTVQKLLLRERNAGILMNNGAEMPNSQIEPIITRAELEALQARVKTGTGVPVSARTKSALGGILKCECGAPMHATVSYSQRKGGPRHTYQHYKCSQTLYDKSRRHASITQPIADKAVALQVLSYIALGVVTVDEAPAYGERIRELSDRLAALDEQEARAEDALVEGLGNKARMKGKLEVIRAERLELKDERERLEASRVGGNVFRVIEELRDVLEDIAYIPGPLFEDEEEAIIKVYEAWDAVSGEDQQALIRGRFKASVRVGGRGEDRVTVEPR